VIRSRQMSKTRRRERLSGVVYPVAGSDWHRRHIVVLVVTGIVAFADAPTTIFQWTVSLSTTTRRRY